MNLLPEEPLFCKDCARILVGASRNYDNATCGRTKTVQGYNLVSGVQIFQVNTCAEVRADETKCGREGKWFELYQREGLTSDRQPIPGYLKEVDVGNKVKVGGKMLDIGL